MLLLNGHGLGSCLERLPSIEPQAASDKLLRIAQLETRVQHLMVVEAPKPRKYGSDLGGDGIIPFTVPAQVLLRLFLEIVDVWHGRDYEVAHRRWA